MNNDVSHLSLDTTSKFFVLLYRTRLSMMKKCSNLQVFLILLSIINIKTFKAPLRQILTSKFTRRLFYSNFVKKIPDFPGIFVFKIPGKGNFFKILCCNFLNFLVACFSLIQEKHKTSQVSRY